MRVLARQQAEKVDNLEPADAITAVIRGGQIVVTNGLLESRDPGRYPPTITPTRTEAGSWTLDLGQAPLRVRPLHRPRVGRRDARDRQGAAPTRTRAPSAQPAHAAHARSRAQRGERLDARSLASFRTRQDLPRRSAWADLGVKGQRRHPARGIRHDGAAAAICRSLGRAPSAVPGGSGNARAPHRTVEPCTHR